MVLVLDLRASPAGLFSLKGLVVLQRLSPLVLWPDRYMCWLGRNIIKLFIVKSNQLKGAPLGLAPALLVNVRIFRKGLPGTNTLAHFASSLLTLLQK